MSSSNSQWLENLKADLRMRQQQIRNEPDPNVRASYEAEFERIQKDLDKAKKNSSNRITRLVNPQATSFAENLSQVNADITRTYDAYMTASEEARSRRAQSYAAPHHPFAQSNISLAQNPAPHPSSVHPNATRSHSAFPPSAQSMASSQYSSGRPRDSASLHHSQSDASMNSIDYFNAPQLSSPVYSNAAQAQSVATFSSADYFDALERLPPSLYHPHAPGAISTDPSSVRNSAAPSEIIVYPPSTSHPRATTSSRTGYSRSSRR